MKIKDMTKQELELLSYYDIAELLLKENKPMNTPTLFKTICDMLGLSENDYTNKIGGFYTSMTTDKRFILLDSAEWDLRDNHAVKITIDDDEDEEEYTEEIEEMEEYDDSVEMEEDIEEPIDDEELDIDDNDDDLEDLSIVEEEDIDA